MEPKPRYCFICGREVTAGIDSHIRQRHGWDYEEYCKWFYDAKGCYGVYVDNRGRTILTITRILRPQQ